MLSLPKDTLLPLAKERPSAFMGSLYLALAGGAAAAFTHAERHTGADRLPVAKLTDNQIEFLGEIRSVLVFDADPVTLIFFGPSIRHMVIKDVGLTTG